ncbi:protein of unknown function [Shewanella benthica]|uniref:Uncharacterized protein n=1 Tax=Shewanella benthica TaxID=43661 RepID=A0A330M8X1_9GAMM|nr:protein of unknown function [Shewanella benthica]
MASLPMKTSDIFILVYLGLSWFTLAHFVLVITFRHSGSSF